MGLSKPRSLDCAREDTKSSGEWRAKDKERKGEVGKSKTENRKQKMENGKWKMENRKSKIGKPKRGPPQKAIPTKAKR
jgi:hypothetical protein